MLWPTEAKEDTYSPEREEKVMARKHRLGQKYVMRSDHSPDTISTSPTKKGDEWKRVLKGYGEIRNSFRSKETLQSKAVQDLKDIAKEASRKSKESRARYEDFKRRDVFREVGAKRMFHKVVRKP